MNFIEHNTGNNPNLNLICGRSLTAQIFVDTLS